jgi:hypothetical protein
VIAMVRKGVIIGVVVAVAILVGLYVLGLSAGSNNANSPTTTSNEGQPVNRTQQNEDRIAALLGNDPERMSDSQWRQTALDIIRTEKMDNALLVIHSDTSWSAVVSGSDFVQETVDSFGPKAIEVKCDPGGIFSHVVQKSTDTGVLNLYMAQDGKIIKQGNTAADYGVVSVAGNCAG